jgi:hypothetical protein
MSQHDYVIANGTGAAVRSDLNNALAAIVSQNSGATAPSTTYAYQWWADTTTGLLKLRNAANNAWITLFQLDGEWSTLAIENGSASAPSIYFKDSGTDTGIYSPGTDQVAISTGGTGRLFVNASGNVGLGTSSPSSNLTVSGSTTLLRIIGSGSSTDFRIDNSVSDFIVQTSSGGSGGSNGLHFYNVNTSAYRLSLTNDGKLGIGTTSPLTNLHVAGNVLVREADYIYGNATSGNRSYIQMYGSASGEMTIATTFSNSFIKFLTADTERARIDAAGRLLVGTSTSASTGDAQYAKLQVKGNTFSSAEWGTFAILSDNLATSGLSNNTLVGGITFADAIGSRFCAIQAAVDGTPGSNDYPGRLVFSTTADGASSPTERMRINQAGFTKIFKTGSPHAAGGAYHEIGNKNNVSGDTSLAVLLGDANTVNTSSRFLVCNNDNNDRMIVYGNGNIVNTNNSYGTLSDAKLKENIEPAASQWNDLKSIEIVNYSFIGSEDRQIGVVAQQVESISPGLIDETPDVDKDGNDLGTVTKLVKSSVLYMKAVKALQEAMERIETLEADVAALKAS